VKVRGCGGVVEDWGTVGRARGLMQGMKDGKSADGTGNGER